MQTNSWRHRRAFTLIELLVVIAIISLLSSIVIGSLNQARAKSRDSKRVQDLVQLRTALELYRNDNSGLYPADPNLEIDGKSCWECDVTTFPATIDYSKLQSELGQYLNPRPSDPSVPTIGYFPLNALSGYWYKVNPTRTNYKIVIARTIENINNIPETMRDGGTWEVGQNNTARIYSSDISKDWSKIQDLP